MGPYSSSTVWLHGRLAFPINAIIKIASWHLYQAYEARCKQQQVIKSNSSLSSMDLEGLAAESEVEVKGRRFIRRRVVLYFSTSDLILLLAFIIWDALNCSQLSFEHGVLVSRPLLSHFLSSPSSPFPSIMCRF